MQKFKFSLLTLTLAILFLYGCQSKNKTAKLIDNDKLDEFVKFDQVPSGQSGITFENTLDVNQVMSPLIYINSYNGGGVSVGDINNDGLEDIYFTSNLGENKLYLNKGDLKFEDISIKAGVTCPNSWSTGSTFVDINNDGLLDIYVCRSYYDDNDRRANKLFINNGDLTFTSEELSYGIADQGHSIQSVFFDYNNDGHLDLYIGNTPKDRVMVKAGTHANYFKKPTLKWSDKLYKNNGDNTFTDATIDAGILNYGWMLGVSISDYNEDGWPDIYVAVDHSEPDLLYINNKNGTFTNKIDDMMKHISASSMGIDACDFNNDGDIDLMTLDMLSRDNYNEKTQMGSMDPEKFWNRVAGGYHYQYMRNMLQINNGNGTFSEIAQMANIHRTDWSWSVLGADFNNDGWQDMFITNGYYRTVMDKDKNKIVTKAMSAVGTDAEVRRVAQEYPKVLEAQKNKNVFYLNNGDLTFQDLSKESGLDLFGFSSGAAYSDFDNDGDLDLIVNNTDDKAALFKNLQSDNGKNKWLTINFKGNKNLSIVGTRVELEIDDQKMVRELYHTRGYQSSVGNRIYFGLGVKSSINTLTVKWPDGKIQKLTDVASNQQLTINYNDAQQELNVNKTKTQPLFSKSKDLLAPVFVHRENDYNDYDKQVLLPHKMSEFGPFLSKGDINGDGLTDFFVGGAKGQAGNVYIQTKSSFISPNPSPFEADKEFEDMSAVFFDLEGDGDQDLYVVSGGNEHPIGSKFYQDRIYINDNNKSLVKKEGILPKMNISGSKVVAFDYDKDNDLDLFVAGRQIPGKYPFPASSKLLTNVNGKFEFSDQKSVNNFSDLGLITDVLEIDINKDGWKDLITVGEWSTINVFENQKGVFKNETAKYGLENLTGWWNCIKSADLDSDGDMDLVVGNLGLNYKYQATFDRPFQIYADDIDKNGTSDIVLSQYFEEDILFPVRGRQCSSEQIPEIANEFPTYDAFGKASLQDIYGEELKTMLHLNANTFESIILINSDGKFEVKTLPNIAQISPVNEMIIDDFDGDGNLDIIGAGNLYASEVETGRADAGIGFYLRGDGKMNFEEQKSVASGFFANGNVRDMISIDHADNKYIIVANNNDLLKIFKLKSRELQ